MSTAASFPDSASHAFSVESGDGSQSQSRASRSSDKKKKKKKDKDKKDRRSSQKSGKSEDQGQDQGQGQGGFDDLFFERNSNDPSDWANFESQKKPPAAQWKSDDGWGSHPTTNSNENQVSQVTQGTEALTVSTAGSKKAELPFTTIEVDHAQGQAPYGMVPNPGDTGAVAQFHSEMLQGFLKRNGHEATMAVATAAAFENFLTQQHDVINQLNGGGSASASKPDPYGNSFDEEDRLDAMESTFEDERCADSFAPDSIWDEGSIFRDEKAIMMAEYMQQGEEQQRYQEREQQRYQEKEDKFDEKARMMAEYMQNEETMKAAPEPLEDGEREELAAYHGEMLQSFLQRHGKGDDVAGQTAAAFQDFLRRQQEALGKLSSPGSVCSGNSPETKGGASRGAYSENAAARFQAEDIPGGIPTYISKPPPGLDRDRSVASFHSEGSGGHGRKTRNMVAKHSAQSITSARGFDTRAPIERPLRDQIANYNASQLACFELIRKQAKGSFSDWWCLRFARCADFAPKAAQKVMKKFSRTYLDLNIASMEQAMRTRMVYPLPGVVGRGGIRMLYIKFNRLVPRHTSVNAFADHLVYVLNCMHETEAACVNGIGLICDMTDFTMNNFSVPYISKFLMIVQGRSVPVKTESLLFVNPPKWFGTVWRIMKQLMSSDFLKTKVHRLTFHEMMRHHLPRGCEVVLTNDMFLGRRPADEIVEEFIARRKAIEAQRIIGR